MMKNALSVASRVFSGLLGCLALSLVFVLVVWVGCPVFVGVAHVKWVEWKMRRPHVYEPVGRTLALYCQSDLNLLPKHLDYAWFPAELTELGYGRGSVDANRAHVEMGGGFYHFGYDLELNEAASDADTNVWELSTYSEGSTGRHLMTVRLPATEELSAEELLARAVEGCDRRLATEPEAHGVWAQKTLLLVWFGKTEEADRTCQDWIRENPDHWMARFIFAHLRARLGSAEKAADEFADWVERCESFPHYIYLFLFNMREGRNEAARAAVRKALSQPFVEPPNTSGNKFYLGHNAAVFAFAREDYSLCLAMCDKMLADERREEFWRRRISKLKAAAHLISGENEQARRTIERLLNTPGALAGTTDDDGSRHQRFVDAIHNQDRDFLRDYRNWKDEYDDWFSPLEAYEIRLQGPDPAPLLYPDDWRQNVGF